MVESWGKNSEESAGRVAVKSTRAGEVDSRMGEGLGLGESGSPAREEGKKLGLWVGTGVLCPVGWVGGKQSESESSESGEEGWNSASEESRESDQRGWIGGQLPKEYRGLGWEEFAWEALRGLWW